MVVLGGKALKAGYETGEQAAVSTPPIADVGLTPRKRKHAVAVARAWPGATPFTSGEGPPAKQPRLQGLSEGRSLLPDNAEGAQTSAAGRMARTTAGSDTPPALPYARAARGAYVAASAVPQRTPAPSLLGPASEPVAITLQVASTDTSDGDRTHVPTPRLPVYGTQLSTRTLKPLLSQTVWMRLFCCTLRCGHERLRDVKESATYQETLECRWSVRRRWLTSAGAASERWHGRCTARSDARHQTQCGRCALLARHFDQMPAQKPASGGCVHNLWLGPGPNLL